MFHSVVGTLRFSASLRCLKTRRGYVTPDVILSQNGLMSQTCPGNSTVCQMMARSSLRSGMCRLIPCSSVSSAFCKSI